MAAKKKRGRWIQRANARMEARGTKGSYGHKTDAQKRRDIAKGGALGKKAQFALAMSRISKRRKNRTRKRTSRR